MSCIYYKCKLGCQNEKQHRARYATHRQEVQQKPFCCLKQSPKINYERLHELYSSGIFRNHTSATSMITLDKPDKKKIEY